MSLHIGAQPGEIAPTVLITGDPLRAKYHAEKFLSDSFCYNHIRGMLGYTGMYRGKKISIQGTGIGIPSTALYVHELIHSYGVTCIIRVGTCGAIQQDIKLGEILLAEGAHSDSNVISVLSGDHNFKPVADTALLHKAQSAARNLGIATRSGKVFSTDLFYSDEDPGRWNEPLKAGVMGVDMETSVLYTMAAKYSLQSLSILTVSDNILTGETASAEDREMNTPAMIKLALEIAP